MIDYARPHDHNMCDVYSSPVPAPARLDDFQVFKKGNAPYIYTNYFSNNYESYAEPELPHAVSVYHTLVSRESCRDAFKTKMVTDWTEDDTVAWIVSSIFEMGLPEYEVPYFNFKMKGAELYRMRRDDFTLRMLQPHIDPMHSRSIADCMFDKLQMRISEENPVFRYADSNYNSTYNVLDLDSFDNKNRANQSDYKPNDLSILPLCESESPEPDTEAFLRLSPEYSCGSDGSKSGDEDDKRKLFKRPPGRPRGSGKKLSKRPRSVSVPEFLRNLLLDPKYCPDIIKWEDYSQAKFRFVKADEVAKLWGKLKQNDEMNFEKFSRAMRYHYKQEVLKSVPTARLVYQFGRKGPDIRTDNPNFTKIKTEVSYESQNFMNLEEPYDSKYFAGSVKSESAILKSMPYTFKDLSPYPHMDANELSN